MIKFPLGFKDATTNFNIHMNIKCLNDTEHTLIIH